jgi:hypothetical protein
MLLGLQRWLASYERSSERGWFAWTEAIGKWATTIFRSNESEETDYAKRITSALAGATWLFVAMLVLAIVGYWWRRRLQSWRRKFGKDRAGSAIAFYQEMLSRLERAGITRDLHLTPREFATSVEWPAVRELTTYYERARFSSDSLDERDFSRIRELLDEVKTAARDLSRSGRWRIWQSSHKRSLRS